MRTTDDSALPLEIETAALSVAAAIEGGASLADAVDVAALALGESRVGGAFSAIASDLRRGAHPWKAFGAQGNVLGLSLIEPLMSAGASAVAFRAMARAAKSIARLRRSRGAAQESQAEDLGEALEVCLMLAHALDAAMPLGTALEAASRGIGRERCTWASEAAERTFTEPDLCDAFGDGVPVWFRELVMTHAGSESLVDELRRAVEERAQLQL